MSAVQRTLMKLLSSAGHAWPVRNVAQLRDRDNAWLLDVDEKRPT